MGETVRRYDPDRYFCTLFAPAEKREVLFTLYAFNHELARCREVVREPFAALIRLQWWREVVEGGRTLAQVGRHEVAGPVRAAVEAGTLDGAELLRMIEAREMEAEPIETLADFETYVRGSAGGVMVAAARALGMADAETVRDWGAAYGVAGVLRSAEALAAQGRSVIPVELVAAARRSAGPDRDAQLGLTRLSLRRLAMQWLASDVQAPWTVRSAILPTVLARRDVAPGLKSCPARRRGMRDRIAVTWRALL